MSRPSLVEISDTTQMRFDDGEVVTGEFGYGWWWTKEYARRENEEHQLDMEMWLLQKLQ